MSQPMLTGEKLFKTFWENSLNFPKKRLSPAEYPKKFIKTREQFYELTNIQTFTPEESRQRPTRSSQAPPAYVLNAILFYINKREYTKQIKVKISAKVWADILGYCHIIANVGSRFCRLYIGEGTSSRHYIDLVTPSGNEILTVPIEFIHGNYVKSANLVRDYKRTKYTELGLSPQDLRVAQKQLKSDIKIKPFLDTKYAPSPNIQRAEESIFSDNRLSDISMSEEDIEAEEMMTENLTNNNNNLNITSFDDEADQSDFLPAPPDISSISEAHDMILDETIMDEELVERINNDNIITSLVEPSIGEENIHHISRDTLERAERSLLDERVREHVRTHHEKNANAVNEESFNSDFLKKLENEVKRANIRARDGQRYTGFVSTGDVRENPGINPEAKPQKSFKGQDDDFLDYAFYGFVRESGTVLTEIMKLPLGYDYNSQRRGSNVYVRAIHFKNTFTHVSGTKAQGRMIVFSSVKECTSTGLFGRSFNSIPPHDILQKSVTMYAGDIENLETIDLFYNPTILSPYDFKNIVLGNKYNVLYDYYAEINTQAVKGVVGENIESVDSVKTKWVKLDNLDIPLFYDGDDKVPTRGLIGILFMGDYFGGLIETNLVMRIYYNSK